MLSFVKKSSCFVFLVCCCLGVVCFGLDEVKITKLSPKNARRLKNVAGESTGLKIIIPDGPQGCQGDFCNLKGEYLHSDALFGVPPYGGEKKITGEIFYVTPGSNETGCVDYNPYDGHDPKDKSMSAVYLIDRGDCHFVEKVRYAELKGAAAVIVADNNCLCTNYNKKYTTAFNAMCDKAFQKSSVKGCEGTIPFMADDGSGGDINIPSFLVTMFDAQRIKDCYLTSQKKIKASDSVTGVVCKPGTPIITTLQWDMPNPDGNVEWELWTSSDQDSSFKRKFKDTSEILKPSTTFVPHYFIYDGEGRWRCTQPNVNCGNQCTHDGRYCNPDPDDDLSQGVSGADVVMENLRQLCVWQQANATSNQNLWWDYVVQFSAQCRGKDGVDPDRFNAECSESVHKAVGLDWETTRKCVNDSTDSKTGVNKLLDNEIKLRADKNILNIPTVIVNNVVERGTVTPVSVLSTICSGFKTGTEPDLCACVEQHSTEDVMKCSKQIKCTEENLPFFCNLNNRCYASASECTKCSDTSKPFFCPIDNKCYTDATKCTDNCPPGHIFCNSNKKCYTSAAQCPLCPADKQFYCSVLGECKAHMEDCVEAPSNVSSGVGTGTVVVIVLLVAGVMGTGGFLYWRRARAQMRDEVRNILAEYMPLEEVQKKTSESDTVGLI